MRVHCRPIALLALLASVLPLFGCSPTMSEEAASDQVTKEDKRNQSVVDNTEDMVRDFGNRRGGMRAMP